MSEHLSPFHNDPDLAGHNPAASLTQVVVRRDRGRARTDIGKGSMRGPEVQTETAAEAASVPAGDAPLPQDAPRAPEEKPAQAPPQARAPEPQPALAPSQAPAPEPQVEPAAAPNAAPAQTGPAQANGAAAAYAQRARLSAADGEAREAGQTEARAHAAKSQQKQPAPTARQETKPKAASKPAPAPAQAKPAPAKPTPQSTQATAPSEPAPASVEGAAKAPSEPAPKAKTPAESQRRRPLVAPEPPRAERDAAAQARAATKPAAPKAPAAQAEAPSESSGAGTAPAGPQGLVALWKHSAGGRDFPAIEDIDLGAIAESWPNSLLLRVHEGGRPDVEVVRIFRSHTVEAMDTVTIERMMALVRETGRSGEPMHESDPVQGGSAEKALGIIALPFGRAPDAVDHVLCHAFRHGGAAASTGGTRGRIAEPDQDQGQRSVFSKLFGW